VELSLIVVLIALRYLTLKLAAFQSNRPRKLKLGVIWILREKAVWGKLVFTYVITAEMLGLRGQCGLEAKILASASALASNIWSRPGLGLQQKNQEETDQSVCTLLCRLQDITLW